MLNWWVDDMGSFDPKEPNEVYLCEGSTGEELDMIRWSTTDANLALALADEFNERNLTREEGDVVISARFGWGES